MAFPALQLHWGKMQGPGELLKVALPWVSQAPLPHGEEGATFQRGVFLLRSDVGLGQLLLMTVPGGPCGISKREGGIPFTVLMMRTYFLFFLVGFFPSGFGTSSSDLEV